MKVGFFGTYFFRFEDILNNACDDLSKDDVEIVFFSDESKYEILFSDSIRKTYNDSSTIAGYSEIKPVFSDSDIDYFFFCDKDRHEEYNVTLPTNEELIYSAEQIQINFAKWIKQENPDIIISEGEHNFFNRVILDYCKKNSIDYYSFKGGRISNSTYISRNNIPFTPQVNTFTKNEATPDYMNKSHPNHRGVLNKFFNFKSTSLYRNMRVGVSVKRNPIAPYHISDLLLILKTRQVFAKNRFFSSLGYPKINLSKPNKKFIVYPEHFRPEASTSAYDPDYIDDVENIKMLRTLIGDDYDIVFRFHPSYFMKRKTSSLKALLQIEGLYFSLPSESLSELLTASEFVLAISSSVILDACRLGVDSVVLGHPEFLIKYIENKQLQEPKPLSEISSLSELPRLDSSLHEVIIDDLERLYIPYSVESGKWVREIISSLKVG